MNNSYLLSTLLIVGVITFALRALPFFAASKIQGNILLNKLKQYLPIGIMCFLVVYAAGAQNWKTLTDGLFQILSIAVVIIIHCIFKRLLLSVLCGTIAYMVLINFH